MELGFDRVDQRCQATLGVSRSKNAQSIVNIVNYLHRRLQRIASEVPSYLLDFTLNSPSRRLDSLSS